jgi:hypothetical protein
MNNLYLIKSNGAIALENLWMLVAMKALRQSSYH